MDSFLSGLVFSTPTDDISASQNISKGVRLLIRKLTSENTTQLNNKTTCHAASFT